MDENAISNAKKFLEFLNKSPTPYHVVENVGNLLKSVGFKELKLQKEWTIEPGKYFVTKNDSTLVAFAIGNKYSPGKPFSIVAAHTGYKLFGYFPSIYIYKKFSFSIIKSLIIKIAHA